ncbi:hypothetical protein ACFWAN_54180 [Streptomyces mirabilis]|uniref:hypothetical protein n=1 Tax=Streptomyces mirabilis TaxID=68239 RepID=UPI0036650B2E
MMLREFSKIVKVTDSKGKPVGLSHTHRFRHGARGVGLVALPVPGPLQEQVTWGDAREVLADPLPLFLDNGDNLGVDEDVVRRDIDLALCVVEAGDLFALGGVDGSVGDRGEALEAAGADLAGPPSGEDLQQDHAHGLRVVEAADGDLLPVAAGEDHLLVAGEPEQGKGGGDLCECVVVDVVLVVEFALVRDAGDLAEPSGRVRVGDPRPRVGTEDLAGRDGVGGDEREECGDGPQVVVDQAGVDGLRSEPLLGASQEPVGGVGVPAAEGGGQLDRVGRVAQDVEGVGEGLQPPVEAGEAPHPLLAHRRPAQRAGLQLSAQAPLHGLPQPRLTDP